MPKKSTGGNKGTSGPRELITPTGKGSSRYQRRQNGGQFGDADQVSRSQPDDKAKGSKTKPPRIEGDKGDYPKNNKVAPWR